MKLEVIKLQQKHFKENFKICENLDLKWHYTKYFVRMKCFSFCVCLAIIPKGRTKIINHKIQFE